MPEPFLHEDQVQPPAPPLPDPPRDGDAGRERAPTTAHPDEGWRAVPTVAV